jgi:hypothetical protein
MDGGLVFSLICASIGVAFALYRANEAGKQGRDGVAAAWVIAAPICAVVAMFVVFVVIAILIVGVILFFLNTVEW